MQITEEELRKWLKDDFYKERKNLHRDLISREKVLELIENYVTFIRNTNPNNEFANYLILGVMDIYEIVLQMESVFGEVENIENH